MNLYRTAISALVLTPIIGGIGAKMMYEYYNTIKSAENYAEECEEQMEQTTALLDQLLGETLDETPDDSFDEALIKIESPDPGSDILSNEIYQELTNSVNMEELYNLP